MVFAELMGLDGRAVKLISIRVNVFAMVVEVWPVKHFISGHG